MPSRRTLRASFQVKKETRKCGTVIPHCDFSKERMEILVFIRVSIRFPLRMRAQAGALMRACVCVTTRPSRQSPAPSPLPPSHTPRGVAYGLQASPLLVPSSCRQALRSLTLATCPPACLTSIVMLAGFSLPRPPSCALTP